MATAVRQRVSYRFSEDGEPEGHILDEQEQEEVIERLRKGSEESNIIYLMGMRVVIGLSLLLHIVYLINPSKVSPLDVILPSDAPSEPIPLANGFTLLQLLIQLHLCVHCYPTTHRYRQKVSSFISSSNLTIPLPITHPLTIILPMLAPAYALVLGRSKADVVWWAIPGVLTLLVALIMKWMNDEREALDALEKLRYTARGA